MTKWAAIFLKNRFKRALFIFCFLILSSCANKPVDDQMVRPAKDTTTLKITTFNVRWFGLGGKKSGDSTQEKRDLSLKAFLYSESAVAESDLIVFQEIVDPDRIQNILPTHICKTYSANGQKHQHIVLCLLPKFDFVSEKFDDNFAMEEVNIKGNLRPALHGVLKLKNGSPLMHVIAVHLKAKVKDTPLRLKQLSVIKSSIDNHLTDGLPIVLAGDFNTHAKIRTRLLKDDAALFEEILQTGKRPLRQVVHQSEATFRTVRSRSLLDHFWVSPDITVTDGPLVSGVCKDSSASSEQIAKFYREISDHCPVTIKVSF